MARVVAVETVKVAVAGGFKVINKSDFNEKRDKLFVEPAPAHHKAGDKGGKE